MNNFLKKINLTKHNIYSLIIIFICMIICISLMAWMKITSNNMYSQQMAKRWSDTKYAQISCFFSDKSDITPERINNYTHMLENALLEKSIDKENENEKQVAACFSARGYVNIENNKNTLEAKAVGVGGDFFLFHPIKLLNGSYFSDDDIMKDYIIIDEDVAWQIFGSNNVDGMTVYISDVPHIVKGVIRRDKGKLNDYAGNDKPTVYMSYESLSKYGQCREINTFELTLPNPVSHFAYNLVKDKINIENDNMEIVENTDRYSLVPMIKVIAGFGSRSMSQKEIVYPYWENVARGYEDIFSVVYIICFLCIITASGIILAAVIKNRASVKLFLVENLKKIYKLSVDKFQYGVDKLQKR